MTYKNLKIFPDCENLISNMLVVDSEKRYSIAQIVQHPWMRHQGSEDATPGNGRAGEATTSNLAPAPAELEGGPESEDEECGVFPDSELGQQILSHMANLGLDKDAIIQVKCAGLVPKSEEFVK